MRRLPIIIAAVSSALVTALVVAIASPASNGGSPAGNGGKEPNVDAFISCVRSHDLADAPTDPMAFKPWIGARLEKGDEAVKRALQACEPAGTVEKPAPKDDAELRSCLQSHGAQISGDGPLAIKQWVSRHMDDPNTRDALKACDIGGPPDKAIVGECAGKVTPAPGDERAKQPAPAAAQD
jgi:hypothetical protein